MKPPALDLEVEASSENDSDVTSQVASNISTQENFSLSPHHANSVTTPSVSEPLSLDLSLSFNSITNDLFRDSVGFSISSTSAWRPPERAQERENSGKAGYENGRFLRRVMPIWKLCPSMACHLGHLESKRILQCTKALCRRLGHSVGRFEIGHVGPPIFMEEEEAELLWPGSFRQIDEERVPHHHQSFVPVGSLNANFLGGTPSVDIDESTPDLTLRL
ncbi:zinc finger protein 3 [Actinidia rufa]|uniref:Zinc finger protein 3 n=1 Tax=Actinidia rufa TaxID=165716 RepID=A0A7J0F659_9ERIC|nr:zinc finger protein 3 [Actinidia rufa]